MAADYYETLGVSPEADQAEIKKAFRELARRNHPDATGGDPESAERYKRISEAYSVLSDPARRREYDASRLGVGGFSPFATTIEYIFDTFFGGGGGTRARQRTRSRRGDSIEIQVEIDLIDAIFGASRTVSFQRYEPCEACDGRGAEPGSEPVRCTRCGGTGQVQEVRRSAFGSLVTAYPCAACAETGEVVLAPCSDCAGRGRVQRDVDVSFDIPAGVQTGDRLRLRDEGEAGASRGPRGDLFVRFKVEPDDRFVRSGEDLVTWVEVPMTTAALGGHVSFDSLDGPEQIEVPRGTQSGALFRIRGRGAPRQRGRGRGDLLVRIHVVTPTDLDSEQERLLQRLADIRQERDEGGRGILGRLRRALRLDDDFEEG